MFARGATPGKVKSWSYDNEDEDFTKGDSFNIYFCTFSHDSVVINVTDATALDVWVLDQLRTLLNNATTDAVLDSQLRSGRVVFFLHLLGLDTTGHSYRPHSKVSRYHHTSIVHISLILKGVHE